MRGRFFWMRVLEAAGKLRAGRFLLLNAPMLSQRVAVNFQKFATPWLAPAARAGFRAIERNIFLLQPGRSGGNLVLWLLDGHPHIAVRPYHFRLARGSIRRGAIVPPDYIRQRGRSMGRLWRDVFYDPLYHIFDRRGYALRWSNRETHQSIRLPFSCRRYYSILKQQATLHDYAVPRMVDAAIGGYFHALRNYPYDLDKASHALCHVSTTDFGSDYRNLKHLTDNATFLTFVRKPENWVASYLKLTKAGVELDDLLAMYSRFLEGVQAAENDVIVYRFEDMVEDSDAVLGHALRRLGVPSARHKLTPTLLGTPMESNTSFPDDKGTGAINRNVANRGDYLTKEQRRRVEAALGPLYNRIAFTD